MEKSSKKIIFKDGYSESVYLLKRMNEASQAILNKKLLLKEDEFRYPNMDRDIVEDIDNIKKGLNGYLLKIDEKTAHHFFSNPNNVVFNAVATIKDIEFGFTYSLAEEGCLISMPKTIDSFPLYNEIIQFFNDVKKFYVAWKQYWVDKLNDLKQ